MTLMRLRKWDDPARCPIPNYIAIYLACAQGKSLIGAKDTFSHAEHTFPGFLDKS